VTATSEELIAFMIDMSSPASRRHDQESAADAEEARQRSVASPATTGAVCQLIRASGSPIRDRVFSIRAGSPASAAQTVPEFLAVDHLARDRPAEGSAMRRLRNPARTTIARCRARMVRQIHPALAATAARWCRSRHAVGYADHIDISAPRGSIRAADQAERKSDRIRRQSKQLWIV